MNYLLVYMDGSVRRIWITESEQEAHNLIAHYGVHGYKSRCFWLFHLSSNMIKDC